uniref:gamma-glutamylcyclotransferase n=1 Tax=Anisakis simplex TaxID=6269 RepID=A0A0M3K4N7_ANISI
LRGHKLAFYDHTQRWMGAVASVERSTSENDEVWGCVWRVSDSYASELDKQERGYHRLTVEVEMNGVPLECRTYQYSNPSRKSSLPSPHYKQVIVSGAIQHSLPIEYIDKLKLIEDNGFVGKINMDLDAIKHLNYTLNSDN